MHLGEQPACQSLQRLSQKAKVVLVAGLKSCDLFVLPDFLNTCSSVLRKYCCKSGSGLAPQVCLSRSLRVLHAAYGRPIQQHPCEFHIVLFDPNRSKSHSLQNAPIWSGAVLLGFCSRLQATTWLCKACLRQIYCCC